MFLPTELSLAYVIVLTPEYENEIKGFSNNIVETTLYLNLK